MVHSIFTTVDTTEDRQICERMVSKNLDLAQRENILFLTSIPQDSPYYSPPAVKKLNIFQFFIHHALKFAARVENPPLFPSITAPAPKMPSLSEREPVPNGRDPLSLSISSNPAIDELDDPTVSLRSVNGDKLNVPRTFASYQLVIAHQAARLLSWRRSVPITTVVDNATQTTKSLAVDSPQTSESRQSHPRSLYSATGFVTSSLRAQLFGSETDKCTSQVDMIPLLTPLQRAIAQAREHGYHLHPRQPLSTSTSPTSPVSSSQRSPPGLAHLRNRYTLRSHQVAAGDYFRKEATHRAAVAARNLNRHLLIKKADRSLYEPSGIIMPDYELTRLRVVLAPRRFPIRLWKREYRGPADWIEVEDRSPTGGPIIFKRDSHLRKELVLRVRRNPVPKFSAAVRSPAERKPQQAALAVPEKIKNSQDTPEEASEGDQGKPTRLTASQMATLLQVIKRRTKATDQSSYKDAAVIDGHSPNGESTEETMPGDVSASPTTMKPAGLRVCTQVDRPATPGCLDPVMAEVHRKSLLKKYYNTAPKPSVTPKHDSDSECIGKPELADPSSSEETLCETTALETGEKPKLSTFEPHKEVPNSVAVSNITKPQIGSDLATDRPTRLSLSPRRALRAVKSQAKSLGF